MIVDPVTGVCSGDTLSEREGTGWVSDFGVCCGGTLSACMGARRGFHFFKTTPQYGQSCRSSRMSRWQAGQAVIGITISEQGKAPQG